MRARYLAAASAVVLIAGSASWHYLAQDLSRTAATHNIASYQPPRPEMSAPKEPAKPTPAQAPTTGPIMLDRTTSEEDARLDTRTRKEAPSSTQAQANAPEPAPAPAPRPLAETRASPVRPAAPQPSSPLPPQAAREPTHAPDIAGNQRMSSQTVSPSLRAALEAARGRASAPDGAAQRRAEMQPGDGRIAPSPAPVDKSMPPPEPAGRDRFAGAAENPFKSVREAPVSTFSFDVDTASYAFTRASLNRGVLPQSAAVRIEEMINYFPYSYPAPASASEPFRTTVAVFPSPWSEGRKIIQVGVKGYAVEAATRPRANLVFLIDTSGSMNAPNRLPLVKQSLAMLLTRLEANDRVAIVTYAGHAGTALESTPASEKGKILGALERLGAGGSTAGAEGIRQAYALAEQNFDPKGVNRVILATDGDFNVGITSTDELQSFIERQRGKGIFLSILGYGMGNYNDAMMQVLAQNGNGVAAYIDTLNEARKVLVEEATSTLIPIAKDAKIQVEFNPATVADYRLVGYETRMLNRDDFANDKVDAGDIGSGQTITALYEIVPVGGPRLLSDLRYGNPADPAAAGTGAATTPAAAANEYAFVKIRYKLPSSDVSTLISTPVDRTAEQARFEEASADARFATSVAAFAEILRGGRHTGTFSYDDVLRIATAARGDDPFGYRSEFLQLVRAAKTASAMHPLRP
jgi:Ca-activated chloride channel homolog